ncbi:MAG: DNA replication/repair protein RecF, partial [Marinilabiliaceae bacterium]
NIGAADLTMSAGVNCLVGENGAGKTNILDAIYYLSFCKSLSGLTDSLNIRHEEPFFVVQGTYDAPSGREEVYCGFKRGQKKQFKRNKKEYQRLSDHIGLLPLVVISPADEALISESAEARRKYADGVISQCDKTYMESLMAHNRLLTQRNILLKQMAASERPDLGLLDVYDQQIAHHGNIISAKRREFVEWLKPVVTNLYNQISDGHEDVGMAYATCLDRYDLYGGLVEARPRDLILGYTSRGVQKDDIEITMDGYQIKRVGSQGQRKSFVIALKLAQYHYLTERKATRPLLLLDDVFDKLDSSRGDRLIAMMASDDFGQTFITDTDMARLKDVLGKVGKDYKIFIVDRGKATEADPQDTQTRQ